MNFPTSVQTSRIGARLLVRPVGIETEYGLNCTGFDGLIDFAYEASVIVRSASVAGAEPADTVKSMLEQAGFVQIDIVVGERGPVHPVASASIRARKP